ncbi:hypothetical protein HDU93_000910 [Gonapodya sp. JEL0774]|nr:hypothetical protein HDU93_000910 [Gonapodya sp. JEL0774]
MPFLVAIPFQTGPYISSFVSWSSLFTTSLANFVLPIVIYLRARKFREEWRHRKQSCLTDHQKELLTQIHPESDAVKKHLEKKARQKGTVVKSHFGGESRIPDSLPPGHTASAVAILASAFNSFATRVGLSDVMTPKILDSEIEFHSSRQMSSRNAQYAPSNVLGSVDNTQRNHYITKSSPENALGDEKGTSIPTFVVTGEGDKPETMDRNDSVALAPPTPQIRPIKYGSHLSPDERLLRQPSTRSVSGDSNRQPHKSRTSSTVLSVHPSSGMSLSRVSVDTSVLQVPGATATLTLDGVEVEVNDPLTDDEEFADSVFEEEQNESGSHLVQASGGARIPMLGLSQNSSELSRKPSGLSFASLRLDGVFPKSQSSTPAVNPGKPADAVRIEDSARHTVYRSPSDTFGVAIPDNPLRIAPTILEEDHGTNATLTRLSKVEMPNPIAITRSISRNIQLELDGARVFSATGGSLFGLNRTSHRRGSYGGDTTSDTHRRETPDPSHSDMNELEEGLAMSQTSLMLSDAGREQFSIQHSHQNRKPIRTIQNRMGSILGSPKRDARKSTIGLLEEEPDRRFEDPMSPTFSDGTLLRTPTTAEHPLLTSSIPSVVVYPGSPPPGKSFRSGLNIPRLQIQDLSSDTTMANLNRSLTPELCDHPASPTSSINSFAASETIAFDRPPVSIGDRGSFPSLQRSVMGNEDVPMEGFRQKRTSVRTIEATVVPHETFASSSFKSVPDWVPWPPLTVAIACLVVLSSSLVLVIAFNVVNAVTAARSA